ncbi:MAG TPA: M1 family metallopeptidase [Saprospiraceae bacterium]|nr:M1 family metallopeptidase [Saprospiraceae bacterium]HMQ85234.1 M1 family metallopeptidase [Saprospiraceae bacterium]
MKTPLLLAFFFGYCQLSFSQLPYFQQQVDCQIEALLDDRANQLHGDITIDYQNNSPDTLRFLYFHLWPNAYSSRNTAFAQQMLRMGSTRFYFASPDEIGGIDSLNFKIDQQLISWKLEAENPDIARLDLPKPLLPGQQIRVSTPFRVKIPYCFSRLGHVGDAFQVTQWYPKPAVYDRNGWHPMPYLDMGEFYSEFGNFDVRITLPENYVVAATGTLQTPEEQHFLQQNIAASSRWLASADLENDKLDTFPDSSPKLKTLHYTAEQVHDFAWFADKRFMVQNGETVLPSGKKVVTWAFFTKAEQAYWQNGVSYINRAIQHYSALVGEYPYPQATAVETSLGAGGGMEYPMITNISLAGSEQALDEVITHEVGHNWFYGILAFNERDHPWMDEGLNSYYDHRYSEEHYDETGLELPAFLLSKTEMTPFELAWLFQARRHLNMPPDTHSDHSKPINYFLGAYEIPARAFKYLEKYLGTAEFDQLMQGFFAEWQFKHPQPEDLRQYLEQHSGKNLGWLFDGILYSKELQDYAVKKVKAVDANLEITLVNKGKINGPVPLFLQRNEGDITDVFWVPGFEGEKTVSWRENDYKTLILDQHRWSLDYNRRNDQMRLKGCFKKTEPLAFKFLTGVENERLSTIYWLPILGVNAYDGFMAGLALYNSSVPERRVEWAIAPYYAFESQQWAGLGDVHANFYPDGHFIHKIRLGLEAKSFSFNHFESGDAHQRYLRLMPYLRLYLQHKETSTASSHITWRSLRIGEDQLQFSNNGEFLGETWQANWIHELSYEREQRRKLNPNDLKIALEQQTFDYLFRQDNYLKASLEWRQNLTYQHYRNIQWRVFLGYFLANTNRDDRSAAPGAFNLIAQGSNDYRYDEFYLGRNQQEGISLQQIGMRDGGFKTVIGSGFNLGRSNQFLAALNLRADLPPGLPRFIKPYFDVGYYEIPDTPVSEKLLWNGGLMLSFFNEVFEIYFPLISDQQIQDRFAERGNYAQRIAFRLDIHRLSPWRMVDRLQF